MRWILKQQRLEDEAKEDEARPKQNKSLASRYVSRRGQIDTIFFPDAAHFPSVLCQPSAAERGGNAPDTTVTRSGRFVGRRCKITGAPARYKDPLTGYGYANSAAFKELRKRYGASARKRLGMLQQDQEVKEATGRGGVAVGSPGTSAGRLENGMVDAGSGMGGAAGVSDAVEGNGPLKGVGAHQVGGSNSGKKQGGSKEMEKKGKSSSGKGKGKAKSSSPKGAVTAKAESSRSASPASNGNPLPEEQDSQVKVDEQVERELPEKRNNEEEREQGGKQHLKEKREERDKGERQEKRDNEKRDQEKRVKKKDQQEKPKTGTRRARKQGSSGKALKVAKKSFFAPSPPAAEASSAPSIGLDDAELVPLTGRASSHRRDVSIHHQRIAAVETTSGILEGQLAHHAYARGGGATFSSSSIAPAAVAARGHSFAPAAQTVGKVQVDGFFQQPGGGSAPVLTGEVAASSGVLARQLESEQQKGTVSVSDGSAEVANGWETIATSSTAVPKCLSWQNSVQTSTVLGRPPG